MVGHLNKAGEQPNYRGLGSIDFQATARSVLIAFGRLKDNLRDQGDGAGTSPPCSRRADVFELTWKTDFDGSVIMIYRRTICSAVFQEEKLEQAENLILEYLSQGKYPQALAEESTGDWYFRACAGRGEEGAESSDLSKRAVSGTEIPLKNGVRELKVAILQKLAHLQPCNVPFFGSNKVWVESAESTFQRCSCPRRALTSLQPSG